jgi:hypothetical protein
MTINFNTTLSGLGEEAPIGEVMGFHDQISRKDKMTYTTVFNMITHLPEAQSVRENIWNDTLEHSKPRQGFPGSNEYKLEAEKMHGNPADPNTCKPVFEGGPDPIIKEEEEEIHSSYGMNRNHSWQGVESSSSNYASRSHSPYLGINDRKSSAPAAYYTNIPTNQQPASEDTSDAVVSNMLFSEFRTVPPRPLRTTSLVQDFQLYPQVTRRVSDTQSPEAIPNSADSSEGSSSGSSSRFLSTQHKNEREMALIKRARNTEAARRSRARKMERMWELEKRCDMLMARNEQLEIEGVRLRLLLARDQAIKSAEAFQ